VSFRSYGIIFLLGLLQETWTRQKTMLPDLQINDIVRMRKPHPCGGYEWKVTRLGADIGLECCTCAHRVMLTRRELARRAKSISVSDPGHSPGAEHANAK
jgi:hypothetical protein